MIPAMSCMQPNAAAECKYSGMRMFPAIYRGGFIITQRWPAARTDCAEVFFLGAPVRRTAVPVAIFVRAEKPPCGVETQSDLSLHPRRKTMKTMPAGVATERNQIERPKDPIQSRSAFRTPRARPVTFRAAKFILHVDVTPSLTGCFTSQGMLRGLKY